MIITSIVALGTDCKYKVRGSNTPGKVQSPAAREKTDKGGRDRYFYLLIKNVICFVVGFDPDNLHAVEKLLEGFSCLRTVTLDLKSVWSPDWGYA